MSNIKPICSASGDYSRLYFLLMHTFGVTEEDKILFDTYYFNGYYHHYFIVLMFPLSLVYSYIIVRR